MAWASSAFSNSSLLLQGNIVYHNTGDGIEADGTTTAKGNIVYGNADGIAVDYGNFSAATIENNLIYENTNQGLLITGSVAGTYAGNTIYQPTGDAIDVLSNCINVNLSDNILWAQAGYDLKVDPTCEQGFQSDYNDFYTTGTGSLGSWQGQTFLTQQAWFYQVGQDQHSLTVNPQFVRTGGPGRRSRLQHDADRRPHDHRRHQRQRFRNGRHMDPGVRHRGRWRRVPDDAGRAPATRRRHGPSRGSRRALPTW